MPSFYTHGSDQVEQRRLTAMNRLLNDACLKPLALVEGQRVIDFGAGLGQFTRAMARVTLAPAVGIERSSDQIKEAIRQAKADGEADLLEMREGSVEEPPLRDDEWERFDVAHARFLLEHVSDPPRGGSGYGPRRPFWRARRSCR
jgi:2-polyprenyl-3-methyl-5-hydroxy-6-metoxy-1,4-benzoquinol methylase